MTASIENNELNNENTNDTNIQLKKLPVVIVHGGAYSIPDDIKEASLEGVKTAAITAYKKLTSSSKSSSSSSSLSSSSETEALDALEAAIKELEDNEVFDAGYGSCLTSKGTVEMDAAMMYASSSTEILKLGGIASISNVKNPISIAKQVLKENKHTLYVGEGANEYALSKQEKDIQIINNNELITNNMRKELNHFQTNHYNQVVQNQFNHLNDQHHDTVGCVIIDTFGNIACGTSTGGITCKHIGRVGDSPLSGCGLYCLNNVAGISSTGHGESISKSVLCKHIIDLMSMKGLHLSNAVTEALNFMKACSDGGCGGVVAVDSRGNFSAQCSTERMAWACVDSTGIVRGGIENGEERVLDNL